MRSAGAGVTRTDQIPSVCLAGRLALTLDQLEAVRPDWDRVSTAVHALLCAAAHLHSVSPLSTAFEAAPATQPSEAQGPVRCWWYLQICCVHVTPLEGERHVVLKDACLILFMRILPCCQDLESLGHPLINPHCRQVAT